MEEEPIVINEEHRRFAARAQQLLTDLSNIADDLIKARATYTARGYQAAITDDSLGPGTTDANALLNVIFITADLEEFLNPARRNVVSQVRTDF